MANWTPDDLKLQLERARAAGWLEFFQAAAKRTGVSRASLIAIASRESEMQNAVGHDGHAYGVMQINNHDHWKWLQTHDSGMDPASNIDFGAAILHKNLVHYSNDYQKALAAYNAGIRNVDFAIAKGLDPDEYTTGRDYGKDVLARAKVFRQLLNTEDSSIR